MELDSGEDGSGASTMEAGRDLGFGECERRFNVA